MGVVVCVVNACLLLTLLFLTLSSIHDRSSSTHHTLCSMGSPSAGRDRTGILAALLHHLAETHQDDVLYDYMLSRVGLEPGRVMLEASIKIAWRGDMEGPGFRNLAAIRPSYFHAFMTRLQEEYGGWDRFVREYLGFSDAEVQKIKANLRA